VALSRPGACAPPHPHGGVPPFHQKLTYLTQLTLATRWSTTLSSKANLPHAINCRDLCGAVASKLRSDIRANGTIEPSGQLNPGNSIFLSCSGSEFYCTNALISLVRRILVVNCMPKMDFSLPDRVQTKILGTSYIYMGWVPREQKMLKGHLPRVIYHQVY